MQKRIEALFTQVKNDYPAIFKKSETIELKPVVLACLVTQLQMYSLLETYLRAGKERFPNQQLITIDCCSIVVMRSSHTRENDMPVEQMNISLSSQMARFIRGKVKSGEYTNASEVVRDAVRRMQEVEAAKRERALADFESHLTKSQREGIRRGVEEGIKDVESGHYEEYDAGGLRKLAKELVDASAKKADGSAKTR